MKAIEYFDQYVRPKWVEGLKSAAEAFCLEYYEMEKKRKARSDGARVAIYKELEQKFHALAGMVPGADRGLFAAIFREQVPHVAKLIA